MIEEVLAVMEDSSSGIDTTELVTELNQEDDFDITGDIEETVSLDESEVVVVDYVDNFDDLSDSEQDSYTSAAEVESSSSDTGSIESVLLN